MGEFNGVPIIWLTYLEAALCLKRRGPNGNGVPQDSSLTHGVSSACQIVYFNCVFGVATLQGSLPLICFLGDMLYHDGASNPSKIEQGANLVSHATPCWYVWNLCVMVSALWKLHAKPRFGSKCCYVFRWTGKKIGQKKSGIITPPLLPSKQQHHPTISYQLISTTSSTYSCLVLQPMFWALKNHIWCIKLYKFTSSTGQPGQLVTAPMANFFLGTGGFGALWAKAWKAMHHETVFVCSVWTISIHLGKL